ncbi:hypothetical protein B0I37DRAFT_54717 [Chaetomium sp. MPI-CAGE-AT-0009]|nr:hypothetical protein B0I37DRAFT_54717 [Chaetomium sp. MPI-CAGE-AT-0009]
MGWWARMLPHPTSRALLCQFGLTVFRAVCLSVDRRMIRHREEVHSRGPGNNTASCSFLIVRAAFLGSFPIRR